MSSPRFAPDTRPTHSRSHSDLSSGTTAAASASISAGEAVAQTATRGQVTVPRPSTIHFEPLLWIAAAPLLASHEWAGVLITLAALVRLVSLGPEGWLCLYLAGQPLVHAGLLSAEVDLPVLAVTGLLTNALCGGVWLVRRKAPPTVLTLLAFLAVFVAAAASMVWTHNELTQPLEQRIQLFLSQGMAAVLVLLTFIDHRPRLDRFCVAAGIVVCGVASGMLLCGAGLFSRMHDTPLIDWGRASAIATLAFLVAATFSGKWRAAAYLGMAGIGGLLSISQLLRQSAYAAILSVALCAIAFRHVHAFKMTRLLTVLGVAALGVAVVQGDLLEEKLGRFLGKGAGAEVSNAARDDVASLAKAMIQERPIVGNGFGGFSRELGYDYYPHNMVLEILCEFGVVGMVAGLLPVAFGYRLHRWRIVGPTPAAPYPGGDARELGGEISLVALMTFWTLVSQASYSIPHSCACFPGLLVALLAWQRTRPTLRSRASPRPTGSPPRRPLGTPTFATGG